MTQFGAKAQAFLDLHRPGEPLLLPNPWDAGSAKLLESLGFKALATTSSGHAATRGRNDGAVTRDEAIENAATIVAATELPVSADLENGFGGDPAEVAETYRLAAAAGLAGASIEDSTGDPDAPIFPKDVAVERARAALEVAHAAGLVVTARCENFLHGRKDLADTIERLQAYEEAGADVLFAPGLREIDEVRAVVDAVERPVNVLGRKGGPTVPELAAAGVARISVGGGFAFAALGAVVAASEELMGPGTYGFWDLTVAGAKAARAAFSD